MYQTWWHTNKQLERLKINIKNDKYTPFYQENPLIDVNFLKGIKNK